MEVIKGASMEKIIVVFLLFYCMVPSLSAEAAEKEEKPAMWEMGISSADKMTPEEEERARWAAVFANDMGIYLFDSKSLAMSETEKGTVNILAKAIFNNPKLVAQLDEQYKTKLQDDEQVAFSEMQMSFKVNKRQYVVTETRVYSNKGTLLDDLKSQDMKFKEVPVKTFADSLYEIVKGFACNQ